MATEEELLHAWRDGSAEAANALARRYYWSVYRFFEQQLERQAEDLTQRTFMLCAEQVGSVQTSFRAYLFGIARRQLADALRRRYAEGDRLRRIGEPTAAEHQTRLSALAARRQEQILLLRALATLPSESQMIVALFYWEGMNAAQIAEVFELSHSAMRSRLAKVREDLRGALQSVAASPSLRQAVAADLDAWARSVATRGGPRGAGAAVVKGPDSGYVDLGLIARGGMAEVHLARRDGVAGFRKLVALKRMLPQLADDPSFERMFLAEARLAAGLHHSNLATVIDFGLLGGRYFLAMEYVHGHDLRSLMQRASKQCPDGVIPLSCALWIVRSVAAGLHYAHERRDDDGRPFGLVHRDVSPSNVLVSYEGEVKLTDFGVAKVTTGHEETATTVLKGKLAYMSPEQARHEPVDRRSDVFALGIVLFELTTGYRQFAADNQYRLINAVADGDVTLPSAVRPDYDPRLEAIVARALAPRREDRFPTALALHDALGLYATEAGLRPEGPELGRLVLSLFGPREAPSLEPGSGPTVAWGRPTRPWGKTEPAEPSGPSVSGGVRRRGRWLAVASLVAGVGLGLGLAQAGRGEADDGSEARDAKPDSEARPETPAVAGADEPAPVAAPSAPPPGAGDEPSRPSEEPVEATEPKPEQPPAEATARKRDKPRKAGRRPSRKTVDAASPKPDAVDSMPKSGLDQWTLPE